MLGFGCEGSVWGKVIVYSIQFVVLEFAIILSMTMQLLSFGSRLENRDVPNFLVVIMTFALLLLFTLTNTTRHVMLIIYIAFHKVRNDLETCEY